MNIHSILSPELLSYLISVLIVPLILSLIKAGVSYIESKTKNNKVNCYIKIAENAVETAVLAVSQVYVDSLKKGNRFDELAKKEAFNQAKTRVLSIIGHGMGEELEKLYGDLDSWIDNKIEYYVKLNNAGTRIQEYDWTRT